MGGWAGRLRVRSCHLAGQGVEFRCAFERVLLLEYAVGRKDLESMNAFGRLGKLLNGGRERPWQIAVMGVLLSMLFFQLACAVMGYPRYRSQHYGTAVIYAQTSIDLLRPVIEGFNANGAPTPLELPLWQAAVAVPLRLFGESVGWALFVSWLVIVASVPPLYGLARTFGGERLARGAVLLYLLQPLVFFIGASAGTDGMCLALALWFLYFTERHIRTGSAGSWVGAALFGVLTVLSKAPFFFAAGITAFCWLLQRRAPWWRWLSVAALGGCAGAALMLWTAHCNACHAQAELPMLELRMRENPYMVYWYFGTWLERLQPLNWGKAGWRILNACFGSWALAGVALMGLSQSSTRLVRGWLLGVMAAMLVFFRLIVVATHRHYYLMLSPALAMLSAAGFGFIQANLPVLSVGLRRFYRGGAALVLGLALVQGYFGMEAHYAFDRYPVEVGHRIREHTAPGNCILLAGGAGWGDPLFRLSGRSGLSLGTLAPLESPEIVARLKERGYTTLVVVNESPLAAAMQQVNPGESARRRTRHTEYLPTAVRNWPTVHADEDLLIKSLP